MEKSKKPNKIFNFFKKNKKIILKALLIIAIIGAIAGTTYGILYACGFTSVEKFRELRDKLGDSLGFWAIIVALQIVQVVLIPISNQIISVPVAILFNNELWKVFVSSFIGVEIGTIILYFIGRFGGEKILGFILSDKEKVKHTQEFMRKGKSFYPIGMLIFIIPDDILTTLAGSAKYNFLYVLIVSFLTRAVCVATSVFGFGFIPKYPWIIAPLIIGLGLIVFFTIYFFRKELKKGKIKHESENEVKNIESK